MKLYQGTVSRFVIDTKDTDYYRIRILNHSDKSFSIILLLRNQTGFILHTVKFVDDYKNASVIPISLAFKENKLDIISIKKIYRIDGCLSGIKPKKKLIYQQLPPWIIIKCAVRLLSLHHRAVITANHPDAKFLRGEFF